MIHCAQLPNMHSLAEFQTLLFAPLVNLVTAQARHAKDPKCLHIGTLQNECVSLMKINHRQSSEGADRCDRREHTTLLTCPLSI